MIKKVVPLPKYFSAVGDVARKNIRSATCHRIVEFDVAQFPSIGHVNFAFKYAHIDSFASNVFENTSLG